MCNELDALYEPYQQNSLSPLCKLPVQVRIILADNTRFGPFRYAILVIKVTPSNLHYKSRHEEALRSRVLVVDDIEAVRRGFTRAINEQSDLEVCGEAANGLECIARAPELRPDAVICELRFREYSERTFGHRDSNKD